MIRPLLERLLGPSTAPPAVRWARVAAGAAVILFFLSLSLQQIWVADLWWQLRTGGWIAEHRAVPSVDTLSYTVPGHEWIEMRWLYCLAVWLLWGAGGGALLVLVQTAVLAAGFAVLVSRARGTGLSPPGLILLSLGIWAASGRFVVRPELVSYLLLPVFLVLLDDVRAGRSTRGWILPALQVVWTNAHTLFILGPILAWLFTSGAVLDRVFGVRARTRGPGRKAAAQVLFRRRGRGGRRADDVSPRVDGNRPSRGAQFDGPPLGREVSHPPRSIDPEDAARVEKERRGVRGLVSDATVRRLVSVAALTTAACWINPYFHRGAAFPLLLFKEIHAGSILSRTIEEFRSPFAIDLWTWDVKAAAVLAVVSAACFALNWRRTDAIRLAVWAAFLYLAAVAVRNVALFAFVATWTSLRNLEEAGDHAATEASAVSPPWAGASDPAALGRREADPARDDDGTSQSRTWRGAAPGWRNRIQTCAYAALALALIAGAWLVVSGRYEVGAGCGPSFGLGVARCITPEAATAFLLESGASPQLFHAMSDGSYLTWAAQGRYPVYVDGRLEVYGEEFVEEYLNIARRDFERLAERWKIQTVLADHEHLGPLIRKLARSPRWVLVHLDARDVVFVRDIPEHANLIAKWRIDPNSPWVPRAPEPDAHPSGWRRWIGTVPRPWFSFGMAETFLALGAEANAERYLARAEPLLAHSPLLRLRLGQLYFEAKDYSRSASAFREALEHLPEDAGLRCELGQALFLAGDPAGALDAYAQALRDDPRRYEAHFNMGVILAKRGDIARAIGHFREALGARPGDPAASRILSQLERGR